MIERHGGARAGHTRPASAGGRWLVMCSGHWPAAWPGLTSTDQSRWLQWVGTLCSGKVQHSLRQPAVSVGQARHAGAAGSGKVQHSLRQPAVSVGQARHAGAAGCWLQNAQRSLKDRSKIAQRKQFGPEDAKNPGVVTRPAKLHFKMMQALRARQKGTGQICPQKNTRSTGIRGCWAALGCFDSQGRPQSKLMSWRSPMFSSVSMMSDSMNAASTPGSTRTL